MVFDKLGIGPKNFPVVSCPSLYRATAAALLNKSIEVERVVADEQAQQLLVGLGIGFPN